MTALPGRGWTAMASVGPAIKNCQEQLRKGSQCLRHCMIQIRWLTWLSLLQWYMVYVKIELRQDRQESRKRIEKGEDFIDCLMRSRSFVSVFFHRPEAWSICVNSPRPWFSPGWERTPMEWPLEALKNGSLKFEMIHKWFMIEERRQNSQTVQDFKIGDWDGEDSAQLWGEFRLRAKTRCVRLECTAAASQRVASVESQPMVRQPSTSHFWIKLRPAQELELKTINANTVCIKTAKHVTYITKKSNCVFQKKNGSTLVTWLIH